MEQISHSSYISNGKGVAVKISLDNLTDLDEKKKQIIEMISKLFKQYEKPSNVSEERVSIVNESSDKVKITSDEFFLACNLYLKDKKIVSALNLCNPNANKYLPKSYYIVRGEDNIILNFTQKIDLLRAYSCILYDESTKMLSFKE